jgi:hypothetical protein
MAWDDSFVFKVTKVTSAQMNAIIAKIKNILGEELSLSDSTVNNASTSKHGFFPKLPGTPGSGFFRADGIWAATGAGDITGSTGTTDHGILMADGTGGATFQGSAATVTTDGSISLPIGETYQINGTALAYTDITGAGPGDVTASGTLTADALILGGGTTVVKAGTDLPTATTVGTKYIYRADGTDVPVADGGTGASTLDDGGLICGNGTGAVEVVAPGTTSQILVGGGAATAPVWGADIPTAVTIGTAYIYRAGGTDVPYTDGGTGISTYPKRTLFLSAAGGVSSTTGGAGAFETFETSTNDVNFRSTIYAAGASDISHEWGCVMPDNWDGGTVTAVPIFHMKAGTDASNHTVIWNVQGVSFASTETLDTAYGTLQTSTYTVASSQAGKLLFGPATSAITVGGASPAGGEFVQWRVQREGGDTCTDSAYLLGVKIIYQTNGTSDA